MLVQCCYAVCSVDQRSCCSAGLHDWLQEFVLGRVPHRTQASAMPQVTYRSLAERYGSLEFMLASCN